MAYDIRPLSFSEILDRAFRVYLDNFVLLFGISAAIWMPIALLSDWISRLGKIPTVALGYAIFAFVVPLLHAALIVAVTEVYLGREASFAVAFRSMGRLAFAIVGTYLLAGILVFLGTVLGGGLIGGLIAAILSYFKVPSMLLGVPLAILTVSMAVYFIARYSLIGPVVIIDRHFGWYALRRSRQLVKGAWWRTFGVFAAAALIAKVPAFTLDYFWKFIPIARPVLSAATQALSIAYGMIASVIYYFDRRCRTEEFDLRFLAAQIRSAPAPETVLRLPEALG